MAGLKKALFVGLMLPAMAASAEAETFTWSTQTDPSSMDPHAVNAAPVLSFLNNIYEGLVRRGPDMTLEPSLATSWEPMGTEGWRFTLREGVRFHDGAAFDSDDVVFSFERASSEVSDVKSFFATIDRVEAPDAFTVEFYTKAPDALFPSGIANWLILDRDWAEATGATVPDPEGEGTANREANGTGPFQLVSRVPDEETVVAPFADWWGEAEHNITEAVLKPLSTDATRVAALLAGDVDMIEPVPLQDIERIRQSGELTVHQGVEARVMFLGFDHQSDELRLGDAGGTNPFRDVGVRRAIYQAIDAQAIATQIMRGTAQPTGLLVTPGVEGYKPEADARLETNREAAQAALAEAGYEDGFSFTLRCPNDRYINDEATCTAVVAMLAQIGLDVTLDSVPVSQYWTELREGQFDMYLLGWSPGTFDAEHPIRFLMHTPDSDGRLGSWNFGGYSNARVDELLPPIQQELDAAKRQAMIDEVHQILKNDVPYVPLHVQPLVWAAKDEIELIQRPDNFFLLRWVKINS
ncbi:MAG: ABC transporter substrate-binding protein [Geminicoccaceae bacterium]